MTDIYNTDDVENTDVVEYAEAEAEAPHKKGFHLGLGSIMLLLSVAASAVIFGLALARQAQSQPTSGPAPDFEFTTFDGQSYSLSDFRGKVVMLNFWAGWCAPCADEAPELEEAWQFYKDRGDVVFLGIAYADNGPSSLAFLERHGVTYLNAPDIGTRVSEMYNIQGVPETFIIDQDGNVAHFFYAPTNFRYLRSIIDPLLES
jgi:cytochrome c biogenesis protein CcmG/thiol:disulfide interchange protein DsbE